MDRVGSTQGYTIVETIIFLAVSGFLFTSAALLIAGQQQKAEFQQGVRDFESQIQDIANDVSSGYYATNNSFSCTSTGSGHANISPAAADAQTRGTNVGCIFLGRALQFRPGGIDDVYNVYSVVGNKQTAAGIESQNLNDAQPVAIAPGTHSSGSFINNTIPDAKETLQLPGGITVAWVDTVDPLAVPPETSLGGFGIFTTFGSVSSGELQKGTVSANVSAISGVDVPSANFVDNIDSLSNSSPINPDSGIRICLQSGGTNQHVIMIIGGKGRKYGTKTEFYSGSCGAAS